MNQESQVRGCYNNFYLRQPGNRVGPQLNQMHRQQLELATSYCRDTGGKRTLLAQRTSFNILDNWGHKTPTQKKKKKIEREKGQERKVKGSRPETHTMHSVTSIQPATRKIVTTKCSHSLANNTPLECFTLSVTLTIRQL